MKNYPGPNYWWMDTLIKGKLSKEKFLAPNAQGQSGTDIFERNSFVEFLFWAKKVMKMYSLKPS